MCSGFGMQVLSMHDDEFRFLSGYSVFVVILEQMEQYKYVALFLYQVILLDKNLILFLEF